MIIRKAKFEDLEGIVALNIQMSKETDTKIIDENVVREGVKAVLRNVVKGFYLIAEEENNYKIVGDDEADIKQKKISYQSPIARALIGKAVGDEVRVVTPGGEVEYEIDKVEHI